MSTNLATILVGLGYDLSALEKGAPEAFRMINQQTLGMSAEMKRTSREGAEAWRLIDEALGIHVSRPLTRLITQEFPAFANAMAGLLGAGAFGALAVAGVEFFDKVVKKIEGAREAQEKYAEASKGLDETIGNVLGGIDKKFLELTSKDHTLHIRLQGAEEAKQGIDQISKALDAMQAADEKANAWTTRVEAGIGDFFSHEAEGFVNILDLINTVNTHGAQVGVVHDAIYGTQALSNMKDALKNMRDAFNEALNTDRLKGTHEAFDLAQKDIKIATAYLNDMKTAGDSAGVKLAEDAKRFYESSLQVEQGVKKVEDAQAAQQAHKEAEAQRKEDIREIQGDLKRWNDAANEFWQTWMKINAEIEASNAKLSEIALSESLARSQRAQKLFFPEIGQVGPPPGAPMLKDQEELEKVTTDQNQSWKVAGQILEEIETPAQKYAAALAILKQLQADGRLTTDQFVLAQQKLNEQLQSAADKMAKLLREGGAAGGAQAFMMQLMGDTSKGSTGQFTFDFLTKSLQGFEDETVKAITTGKASWRSYFDSLEQMALKFALNKTFSDLFKTLGESSFGKSLGLGSLMGAANPSQTANTTALGANTLAVTANTASLDAFIASAGARAAGGGADILNLFPIPGFASGTDFAPGGMAWVGENGPELVNLPSGSSVTPGSAARGAQVTSPIYIDARGAQMGVGEQIARSWEQNGPALVTRAVVEAFERQRRSLS